MGKSTKLAGLVAIATSLMAGSVSAGAKFEDGEDRQQCHFKRLTNSNYSSKPAFPNFVLSNILSEMYLF